MKKTISAVLAFLMLCASLFVPSPGFADSDATYYHGSCGTNVVWEYYGSIKTLMIEANKKATNDGVAEAGASGPFEITSTPWKDASWYDSAEKLTIEGDISSMPDSAFSGSAGIKSADLNGEINIGTYAFESSQALAAVTMRKVKSIGNYAFFNCRALATVQTADTVNDIGEGAFKYCTDLTNISLPSGIDEIKEETFSYCSSLPGINIPDSVTKIGNSAFKACTLLEHVNFTTSSSLGSIGSAVFENSKAIGTLNIPKAVTSIDDNAFKSMSSSVTINACHNEYAYNFAKGKNLNANLYCDVKGAVISGYTVSGKKDATKTASGYTGDTVCPSCGLVIEKGESVEATGVKITLTKSDLGTASVNGTVSDGNPVKVPYAKDFTLKATPADGAEFTGWEYGGKIISTDPEYSTAAFDDAVYTPIFAKSSSGSFTVTFKDIFNNVIAQISSADLASLTALPDAPEVKGYSFSGYDLSLEQVKALTESAVVTALYSKSSASYTVTAQGCVIQIEGETYRNTATVTKNDTPVTVTPLSGTASAWSVNGNIAAYGETYTFYVTSDIEITPVTDAVDASPAVASVNGNGDRASGSYKVRFLATRFVPEGCTLLESGFVYGKNMTEDNLTLENVGSEIDGAAVKKGACSNLASQAQFALTYGVKAQSGTAAARAYIKVKDAENNISAIYGKAQIYSYD